MSDSDPEMNAIRPEPQPQSNDAGDATAAQANPVAQNDASAPVELEMEARPDAYAGGPDHAQPQTYQMEESIVLPSSDNDDLGEGERRHSRRLRRGQLGEARLSKYEQFHFTLCALIIATILSVASLIVAMEMTGVPTFLYLQEHKQLVQDWTTQPYVDVLVVDTAQGCPQDYEALFYRPWNGTHALCVESSDESRARDERNDLNIKRQLSSYPDQAAQVAEYARQLQGDYTIRIYDELNSSECYGRIVPPIEPINMTSISDRTACAKRGGPTLLDTVRVDMQTGKCPRGSVPCSNYTSMTDTVCVKEYEREFECPIIDLFVVHETIKPYLEANGFTVTDVGYPQQGDYQTFIAYSKTTTRQEVGQEPVISTSINSVKPCYGVDKERVVLGDNGFDLISFPLEKEEPLQRCPHYEWRRSGYDDERYDIIGTTSLYMLQSSNNVFDEIDKSIPQFFTKRDYNYMDVRHVLQMRVMTRKRYRWDIACSISPQAYYNELWKLRKYFYSVEEQLAFLEVARSHDHSSQDSSNLYHDDNHLDDFHVHLTDLPAEVTMKWVRFLQLGILGYFILCTLHLTFFALKKPKVSGSLRSLRCMRFLYGFFGLQLVLVVIGLEFVGFFAAYSVSQYNRGWILALQKLQKAQGCTQMAHAVNAPLLESTYETSIQSQHIFSFQVMCFALIFNTLIHFCTNYRLLMRWFEDNPGDGANSMPRSIMVGLTPEAPMSYDRRTGLAQGLAVPEADRDVFKKPIHYSMKEAILAIPVKDENGEEIVEDEEFKDLEDQQYKSHVFPGPLEPSARKMLGDETLPPIILSPDQKISARKQHVQGKGLAKTAPISSAEMFDTRLASEDGDGPIDQKYHKLLVTPPTGLTEKKSAKLVAAAEAELERHEFDSHPLGKNPSSLTNQLEDEFDATMDREMLQKAIQEQIGQPVEQSQAPRSVAEHAQGAPEEQKVKGNERVAKGVDFYASQREGQQQVASSSSLPKSTQQDEDGSAVDPSPEKKAILSQRLQKDAESKNDDK